MKKHGKLFNILTSCCLILLTLGTATSATFAWFSSQRQVKALANGFQVVLPEAQKADLYFHSCNYNENAKEYSGFEQSSLKEDTYPSFIKITDENKKDATSTQQLWPNHQLTFALVFTPLHEGKYTFSLTNYLSKDSENKKVNADTSISLAFAIDIYVGYYSSGFSKTNSSFFSSAEDYFKKNKKDLFDVTPEKKDIKNFEFETTLEDTKETDTQCVLYFTLLFSNDKSTFYELGEDNFYHQNNNSEEQSNCYENLEFIAESFTLKYEGEEA